MDDKITSSSDTSEYKFPESESMSETTAEKQSADASFGEESSLKTNLLATKFRNIINNMSRRKLLMPVVIVLAILFIYGIFNFYGVKKASITEQKKVAEQEGAARQQAITPVASVLSQATVTKPIVHEQTEFAPSAVQQKLEELSQEAVSNHNQVLQLHAAVSRGQQEISDINRKINQLTLDMQQVLTEIEKLKAPKVQQKKQNAKPLTIYHIRAIVPGRVWLESSNSKSVTLRVGDFLKDYGRVEAISPRQGFVLMSNGAYIQYGVNDF